MPCYCRYEMRACLIFFSLLFFGRIPRPAFRTHPSLITRMPTTKISMTMDHYHIDKSTKTTKRRNSSSSNQLLRMPKKTEERSEQKKERKNKEQKVSFFRTATVRLLAQSCASMCIFQLSPFPRSSSIRI